jgi:hypothetical protein
MALLDYLSGRRAEIEAQIKTLKGELAEIRIAEAALLGGAPGKTVVTSVRGPSVVREGSIKDWVLKALQDHPSGLETEDVIISIVRIGGPSVPRNSMTPQLSRLKGAGLIEQAGRYWRLLSLNRPPNEETPGVSPPDASVDEDSCDLV